MNTAYHLARAVYSDTIPDDEQTCLDYGFTRACTPQDRSMLLGLYIGFILHIGVKPKDVHRWRKSGRLIEEIKAAFEKIPEVERGSYYKWFLRNQYVLDLSLDPPSFVEETLQRGWDYAGIGSYTPEARTIVIPTWSVKKRRCNLFCALLLGNIHPGPTMEGWLELGFCVCRNESMESELGSLYHHLLLKRTFDEFSTAYETSALIELFDASGLKHSRERFPYLEDVLKHNDISKSVWLLKQFAVTDTPTIELSVRVDYGFMNLTSKSDIDELRAVYKEFFLQWDADPIKLHEAAITGKLFEYVGSVMKLEKKFKSMMKNPYPLLY